MQTNWDARHTDVLVIGSEGAGGRAAIAAAEAGVEVTIATKGRMGKSGATVTAIAGIAVDGRGRRALLDIPEETADTPEQFFQDIVKEGKLVNNQKLVQRVVEDGPQRIGELIGWGMKVVNYSKSPGPGHTFARDIYTSGRQMVSAIRRKARTCSGIHVLEDVMVVDLLKSGFRVVGAVGLNLRTGRPVVLSAGAVILATGGGQTVYPVYTAPEELSGDGQAMAFRAGAELVDMEMIQFHPYDFVYPPAWMGMGFPFTFSRDLEVWLLNRRGERFMQRWDPQRMEHSTRDVLSIAIMNEVLEGRGSPHGGAFMSVAHLPPGLIDYAEQWMMPGVMNPGWRYAGFSFKNLVEQLKKGYAMEVAPACHFFMGGIRTDECCRTGVPGLFAVGEVSGGMNGANRLSNLALTQIFVQGAIGGREAAAFARANERPKPEMEAAGEVVRRILSPLRASDGTSPFALKRRIQALAWQKAGVIREGTALCKGLEEIRAARGDLANLCCRAKDAVYNREWIEAMQCENLLTVIECIARSALARTESRGAHYRKDFPSIDNTNWLKNVVLRQEGGGMAISTRPVEHSDKFAVVA